MIKRLLHFIFGFLLCAFAASVGMLAYISQNPIIQVHKQEPESVVYPSIVLDDEQNEIARFQLERQEYRAIDQIPQHVIEAFIAAEDHMFFSHVGISFKGIVRSLFVNLYYRRRVQGASTITQQLVRLLYLDSHKTIWRKIKEQMVALLIERQLSKHQIMELYLNQVYFGCGIYGVQAAAKRFWDKSIHEVSIDQAAALAAIMKSPQRYCPLTHPLSCQQRRNVVLHSMLQCGFINQETYDQALKTELIIMQNESSVQFGHVKEAIRAFVEQLVGRELLYKGGLVIQTTINKTIQEKSYQEFKKHIDTLRKKMLPEIDGGFLCMETKTGQIKAWIGGYDFNVSQFDRANQAKRQIGSIFKPLVYAAAIEQGAQFYNTHIDEPFELSFGKSIWRPENYSNQFDGQMTLAYALAHSNNIVTIKTLLGIGTQRIIELARKCHISAELQPYPSLALGCLDGTLKEAVGMFNIFANDGCYVQPHVVRWIKDKWGTKIYKSQVEQECVLSPIVAGQVSKILNIRLEKIRKKAPHLLKSQAIGKTGTTNDCRSCWFLGSTPDYTTGTYIGCDDNRSLGRHIYGSQVAFPHWLSVQQYLPNVTTSFAFDPSLKEMWIHQKTGLRCKSNDPHAIPILIHEN